MKITKKIYSEISAGELFDKISILEIKKNKIKDKSKRNIVLKELGSLQETVNKNVEKSKSLTKLYNKAHKETFKGKKSKKISDENNERGIRNILGEEDGKNDWEEEEENVNYFFKFCCFHKNLFFFFLSFSSF